LWCENIQKINPNKSIAPNLVGSLILLIFRYFSAFLKKSKKDTQFLNEDSFVLVQTGTLLLLLNEDNYHGLLKVNRKSEAEHPISINFYKLFKPC